MHTSYYSVKTNSVLLFLHWNSTPNFFENSPFYKLEAYLKIREHYIYCDSYENTVFCQRKYNKVLLTVLSTSLFYLSNYTLEVEGST